jgi:uncharacterized DUF497 family protein
MMIEIYELLWGDENIAHIARHAVNPAEVTEVDFSDEALFFDTGERSRPGRLAVFDKTIAGRLLVVYLDRPVGGRSYPVTARPMTAKEKKDYHNAKEKDDD